MLYTAVTTSNNGALRGTMSVRLGSCCKKRRSTMKSLTGKDVDKTLEFVKSNDIAVYAMQYTTVKQAVVWIGSTTCFVAKFWIASMRPPTANLCRPFARGYTSKNLKHVRFWQGKKSATSTDVVPKGDKDPLRHRYVVFLCGASSTKTQKFILCSCRLVVFWLCCVV